jgi:phosphoribosylglycinamide formyltransferase-1
MKYSFYVSQKATRLKLYLSDKNINTKNISFVLIDNTDNKEICSMCDKLQIPFYQYSYKLLDLKQSGQNKFISDTLLKLFDETNTDYCFIFGGRILVGNILRKYKNKLINFHPSLLPAYKGLRAIDQALAGQALLLGNTAHFLDEDVDTGQIIMQSIIPVNKFKDYDSILNMQIPMLKQIICWLENKRIIFEKDKVLVKNASYEINSFIPNLE